MMHLPAAKSTRVRACQLAIRLGPFRRNVSVRARAIKRTSQVPGAQNGDGPVPTILPAPRKHTPQPEKKATPAEAFFEAAAKVAAAVLVATVVALSDPATADAASCGRTVLSEDFNQYSGKYRRWSRSDMLRDFAVGGKSRKNARGQMKRPGPIQSNARVYNAQVGKGNLKLSYPKDCVGAKGKCGMVMYVRLPKVLDEATVSYKVRFSDNYDWTAGGKLPGLCSDKCPVGRSAAGEDWSGRVMWRRGGKLVSYMYLPGKPGNSPGVDWDWDARGSDDGYRRVAVYYNMNDPGRKNGILRAYVDGKEVYEDTKVEFRENKKAAIEKLALHNYHGGRPGDSRFEPSKRQYQLLDDIKVREGECTR